ncbi:MAG: sortase [bacterium]
MALGALLAVGLTMVSPANSQSSAQLTIARLGINDRPIGIGNTMLGGGPVWWSGITGRPGQGGPMAIAGHDVTPVPGFGAHGPFYHLDRMKKNDIIQVTWRGKLYRYRVTATQVLPESDHVMIRDLGFESLTLSTCWPRNTHTKRYLVRSVLISSSKL